MHGEDAAVLHGSSEFDQVTEVVSTVQLSGRFCCSLGHLHNSSRLLFNYGQPCSLLFPMNSFRYLSNTYPYNTQVRTLSKIFESFEGLSHNKRKQKNLFNFISKRGISYCKRGSL